MIIDAAELKRRYIKRIAGVRDNKVYIGPQAVALDITHACNLTCQYCWFHGQGNSHQFKKAKCFSWERFLEVVSECIDLEADRILITGFGEPTQHPLFRDMMKHLEQQPSYIKVYTNGTFPLDYCLDVIRGDHVDIHLSATDRKQYHNLHGKDLFDHVINNIKRLIFLRDETKPRFRVEINYIVNTLDNNQKQKIQELTSHLGVNAVNIEKEAHVSDEEMALTQGAMERKGRAPGACVDGWFQIMAMSNGNLTICPWVYHLDRADIDCGPLKRAALKQGSLKEVWLSKTMAKMRFLKKSGYFAKKFTACQNCPSYGKNMRRLKDSRGVL